jgi:aspartyl-tRNA(Asn)/glutamyl-tRNA(Gln) amidotransferase subunit A
MSRSGVIAMASSTDTVGTLARSIEDVALVVDVMAGRDPLDGTTIERDSESYTKLPRGIKGKKIGIIKEWMGEGVAPGVVQAVRAAADKLAAAGARVQEVSIPSLPLALAVYYIVAPAEISSNLSRYDGQRYPYSFPDARNLEESYTKSRGVGFGKEAKRRIMIGTYVLSSGYYDAYYRKAQTVRTKLITEFEAAFQKVDFLIGPVAPTTAFKIGEKTGDPLQLYLQDLMTVGPSLAGLPGLSLPAGRDEHNLPVGLHMLAPQRQDRELLAIAAEAEELLS